ncbi:segregation and condensation protein A [Spiroplasma culicicola]|uniref:Segregation and condensation protein A n=1 Tax=Spiroplasma culicicola AES-1 TaxID=1276246 RepID=W6A6Z1_9MOLU|nr:segregation/condensation protein A [Spiroplasma culicicola]AHI52645.1 segregation and condensation protein A [Spiroplasma culicicola AES-1]
MERWESVQLSNFEGPLDLLLHMIKEKEVNIFDVNLLELSNQYLEYIKRMLTLDIEMASEYLVMASYLVELKSKLLIPKEVVDINSNYEEEQREELLMRLFEYHKIKEVTDFFKTQQVEGLKTYSKPKSIIKITKIDDDKLPLAPNNVDIDKFSQIFLKAIEKSKLKTMETNTLNTNEVSPEEIAVEIKKYLAQHQIDEIKLEDLIEEKEFSLRMLVATFLAVLDLASKNIITIFQKVNDVIIKYNKGDD